MWSFQSYVDAKLHSFISKIHDYFRMVHWKFEIEHYNPYFMLDLSVYNYILLGLFRKLFKFSFCGELLYWGKKKIVQ